MIKFCLPLYAFLLLYQINICCAQNTKTELNQDAHLAAPKCDDLSLYDKIMERVEDFSNITVSDSTIVKRQKALLIKNIKGFESVDVKTFKPETDFHTANALISLKINKHLTNDDIILCKQKGNIKNPLYIIVYPQDKSYIGHIINLEQYSADYEKISFIYP